MKKNGLIANKKMILHRLGDCLKTTLYERIILDGGNIMARKYMYLLERIKDGADWKKGMRIWADSPCTGWRIIEKIRV